MSDAVRERYARFAAEEAPGRSALYEEWAAGVAEDPSAQRVIARIPETRRQPPLVFAVTRMLGAPEAGYAQWRGFFFSRADEVVEECAARRMQTNEPLRLAPLLPVLAEIEGPIALLEMGASAGLCLYPDRYSYRFVGEDGALRAALDPDGGPSPVVLESRVDGPLPGLRLPEVVWRAGIDLNPLDARVDFDRCWLNGLVWPGEAGRADRIEASDPPHLVVGDVVDLLEPLAAEAPEGATLVITTLGVLVHVPRVARRELAERIRWLSARWVTIDPPGLLDEGAPVVDAATWPGFVVTLDGAVRAAADPLGRWWEWRGGSGARAT